MAVAVTSDDRLRRLVLATVGLALGAATAFVELAYLLLATPGLVLPVARQRIYAGARALAESERARLARFFNSDNGDDYRGGRAMRYLVPRCVVGLAGAGIFLLILWGAASGVLLLDNYVTGEPIDGEPSDWYDLIVLLLFGVFLLFLAVQGLLGVARLDQALARRFLGPSQQELLQRRVSQLATSRAEVLEAVNDERRRIERDLHDGVQQRLVALGMLLGRARRAAGKEHGGEHTEGLLRQAHEQTHQALLELREVTWRVYPVALDEGGLPAALEAVAERSSVPVRLRYRLGGRLDPATETVAYFVVSESVTNAIKHAAPQRIDVEVRRAGGELVVRVSDDGVGGARQSGSGLSGLARRVAAADGEFTVDSPAGGPTVITARLPCG